MVVILQLVGKVILEAVSLFAYSVLPVCPTALLKLKAQSRVSDAVGIAVTLFGVGRGKGILTVCSYRYALGDAVEYLALFIERTIVDALPAFISHWTIAVGTVATAIRKHFKLLWILAGVCPLALVDSFTVADLTCLQVVTSVTAKAVYALALGLVRNTVTPWIPVA